ncbi:Uncharacterised protein [BD1-7 clade bacterium]|nr:Uncharacterised protein [BD1-7 clade bacterium]
MSASARSFPFVSEYKIRTGVEEKIKRLFLMLTLTHKLIHIRQLIKGELSFAQQGGYYWQDTYYPIDTEYVEQPWEIEVNENENGLI